MTTKEYLQQFRDQKYVTQRHLEKIVEAEIARESISSVKLDPNKVQTSGSGFDEADRLYNVEQLKKKYLDALEIQESVRYRISYRIEHMECPDRFRHVLDQRYLKGTDLIRIAREMAYSEEHVKKLHHDALILFGRQWLDQDHDKPLWTRADE